MTRIAVIGNSQVGALKLGWMKIAADHPGVAVRFFASVSETYDKCRVTEDKVYGLIGRKKFTQEELNQILGTGERPVIRLTNFDAVINVGAPRFDSFALPGILHRSDVEGLHETGAPELLSRACFDAWLDAHCAAAVPDPAWQNWQHPRLLMLPAPRYAETILDDASMLRIAGETSGLAVAMDLKDAILKARLADVGIAYVPQMRETLGRNGLTRADLNRDGVGINFRQARSDPAHMNEAFGVLQWHHILAQLGA